MANIKALLLLHIGLLRAHRKIHAKHTYTHTRACAGSGRKKVVTGTEFEWFNVHSRLESTDHSLNGTRFLRVVKILTVAGKFFPLIFSYLRLFLIEQKKNLTATYDGSVREWLMFVYFPLMYSFIHSLITFCTGQLSVRTLFGDIPLYSLLRLQSVHMVSYLQKLRLLFDGL